VASFFSGEQEGQLSHTKSKPSLVYANAQFKFDLMMGKLSFMEIIVPLFLWRKTRRSFLRVGQSCLGSPMPTLALEEPPKSSVVAWEKVQGGQERVL
jgi:hypothetical protein